MRPLLPLLTRTMIGIGDVPTNERGRGRGGELVSRSCVELGVQSIVECDGRSVLQCVEVCCSALEGNGVRWSAM